MANARWGMVGALLTLSASGSVAQSIPVAESPSKQVLDVTFPGSIRLDVDATDVERGIVSVRETIPIAGRSSITLLFPKWVPGNHAPTARVDQLSGLVVRAGGRRLPWVRDVVDMHAFHIAIPTAQRTLEVEYDILTPVDPGQGRITITPDIANLQWFGLALYPAGYAARGINVIPSVRVPEGWQVSTQLDGARRDGSWHRFAATDFETLIDSPIFAGRHARRFDLGTIGNAPVALDAFAHDPSALAATTPAIAAHRRLVDQAAKLFGPPPFNDYRFMVALSDELGGIGTEHLESSEIVRDPGYLTGGHLGALLAHELVHAWNGKARRPRDSWTPDFNQPIRNSMLWLYEGQTSYWAFVLSARSGLMSRDEIVDVFARVASKHGRQPGRSWRPLADTGNDAIITQYIVDQPWPSWSRELNDDYNEAALMWLEADLLIRSLSGERRSLDDFARAFFAGGGKRPSLYDRADVVTALNAIQPYDWEQFLRARLDQVSPPGPDSWFHLSGRKLEYADREPPLSEAHHRRSGRLELADSIGLILAANSSGSVRDVLWNGPAFRAGVVPGATIVRVNGQPYSPEALVDSIRQAARTKAPIALRIRVRGRERDIAVDHSAGLRFPYLARDGRVPDRLASILEPR